MLAGSVHMNHNLTHFLRSVGLVVLINDESCITTNEKHSSSPCNDMHFPTLYRLHCDCPMQIYITVIIMILTTIYSLQDYVLLREHIQVAYVEGS